MLELLSRHTCIWLLGKSKELLKNNLCALAAEITDLNKAIKGYEQGKKSAEEFIALIDKYQGFEAMTTTMLNEFVEKIRVHERDQKGSRTATQDVEIYFNFVGRYIPPQFGEVKLTPEEQEAQRKA